MFTPSLVFFGIATTKPIAPLRNARQTDAFSEEATRKQLSVRSLRALAYPFSDEFDTIPFMRPLICLLFLVFGTGPLASQESRTSHCIAIADSVPGARFIHRASWSAPLARFAVRIHYISHSSFLIRTYDGLNVVTDYTGYVGLSAMIPDVVTMNHAHETHWTPYPDPAISHVLRGWGEEFGKGVDHHLVVGEMLIRNVSTDIRSPYGGVEPRGNSIFIFEVAGLCIGHLGHLHQFPSERQFAALGRLDVVMAPVDGGMTLPLPDMIRLVERLRSSVVIPMHWFSGISLESFLSGISDEFAIRRVNGSAIELGLRDLPPRPTVVVLEPAGLTDDAE